MIVVGEPSGDLHASGVAAQLKVLCPDIRLIGMGGDLLEKAGLVVCSCAGGRGITSCPSLSAGSKHKPAQNTSRLDFHIRDSAVMGFADVIRVLPNFFRKQAYLKRCIRRSPPDVLLLVDFAAFNMGLAKFAHRLGVPVVYYIPPKAWAWRAGRALKLARWASVVAAIFPFEAAFYRKAGACAEFVGHPLLDFAQTELNTCGARSRLGLPVAKHGAPVITLMPGSRRSEIRHILPVMLEASANIARIYPDARWLLPLAPGISRGFLDECKRGILDIPFIKIVEGMTYPAMRASTLLLVTSGTATLEAACIGTPMIILFRTGLLNWCIIKAFSRVEWCGLPNLLAGREIVPELLQGGLTPLALTELALDFLGTPRRRRAQREALRGVYAQLGTAGAAERTAQLVFSYCCTK